MKKQDNRYSEKFEEYAGTEYQNIKELLSSTMSCIGLTTSVYTDLLLQEWFLLLWDIIWTADVYSEATTSERYEPSVCTSSAL